MCTYTQILCYNSNTPITDHLERVEMAEKRAGTLREYRRQLTLQKTLKERTLEKFQTKVDQHDRKIEELESIVSSMESAA